MTRSEAEAQRGVAAEGSLALMAIFGQGLIYLLAIVLARGLGVEGFDDYAVAAAVFMLTASIAPLGSEKYALRVLPVFIEREDWGRVQGYMRFGMRRSVCMSLMLTMAVLGIMLVLGDALQDSTRLAIAITALAVPLGALVHFGLEVLTALGRQFIASVIFRIVVPATALAFAMLLLALYPEPSGAFAAACWGPAWLLALLLMASVARHSLQPIAWRSQPVDEARHWRIESRPFFLYRLATGLLAQSGLIALALLNAPAVAIGAYAAAVGTAGLASVLASATNRAYGRRLSLLMERQDYPGVMQLRRERMRWLLPSVALFLGIVMLFGRELLSLFRPEFADQGAMALRILAVGISLAVLLALAPTYLKYRRRKRTTYFIIASAALTQIVALGLLVPRFGAMGAASAFTLSMCGMYGAFAFMAHRELQASRAIWAAADNC